MSSWLIIGAGVSGLGAAKLLCARGHFVRISEKSVLNAEKKEIFLNLGVDLRDGNHDVGHLEGIQNVVVSPGVPYSHPLIKKAIEYNLPIISEIDLALQDFKGTLIAVTGTNGKSTTCAMIHHLFMKLGLDSEIGGNYGEPPSAILARREFPPYLVLELSSYQLEQSSIIHPKVAVFTSFSHDHISRHGSLESYFKAKWKIFGLQDSTDLAIFTPEILAYSKKFQLINQSDICLVTPSVIQQLIPPEQGPKEVHNKLNATFACLCVGSITGDDPEKLMKSLRDFSGLPHRCEFIGHLNGFEIINDSKSTNVESTIVALLSQERPVILMMGGQGKGESYKPILEHKSLIAALITFGRSGFDIARDLRGPFPIYEFETLKEALSAISGILELGKHPILFSPGCASFDEFQNYEQRGEVFRKAMMPLCDNTHYPAQYF